MKQKIYLLSFLLLSIAGLNAQENLIPNPSFEDYYSCDYEYHFDPLEEVIPGWYGRWRSPNYHNLQCPELPTPSHAPYDGDGMIRMWTARVSSESGSSQSQIKELAQTELLAALKPSRKYYIEYYLRVAFPVYNPALSHHGILFSDNLVFDLSPDSGNPNNGEFIADAQLQIDTVIDETRLGWTKVSHCFTAEEDWRVMTVGIFAPTDSIQQAPSIDIIDDGGLNTHYYDAFYLIEVEDSLRLMASPQRDTICVGECITFSSNHSRLPGQFAWSLPGSDIGSSTDSVVTACYDTPGVYDVALETEHCHGTYSRTFEKAVVVLPLPAPTAPSVQQFQVAEGDSLQLSACYGGEGMAVRWLPGDGLSCTDCPTTLFYGQEDASLQAIVGYGTPCQDTCYYEIAVAPGAKAAVEISDSAVCAGSCFRLRDFSQYTDRPLRYFFNGQSREWPSNSEVLELCASTPGSYEVVFIAENELGRDTLRISGLTVLPLPAKTGVQQDFEVKFEEPFTLQPGFQSQDLLWEVTGGEFELSCTSCTMPDVVPRLSGEIQLSATLGSCRDSLLYTVAVERQPELMYIPNAFSPNDDGRNDVFRPYGKFFTLRRIEIYDRYGGLLFVDEGTQAFWDGHSAGKPVVRGVYAFVIEFEDIYGDVYHTSGDVMVIR